MLTATVILLVVIALAALVVWCGAGTFMLGTLLGEPLPDVVRDNRDPSESEGLNEAERKDPILAGLVLVKYASKEHNHGICRMLIDALGPDGYSSLGTSIWLTQTFRRWPEFSGDVSFPVPAPNWHSADDETITSRSMLAWHAFRELPKWRGQYGQYRQELLDFLILHRREEISLGSVS